MFMVTRGEEKLSGEPKVLHITLWLHTIASGHKCTSVLSPSLHGPLNVIFFFFFIILAFESGFLYAAQVDLAYDVKSFCLRLLN